jgi:hypothetical protein
MERDPTARRQHGPRQFAVHPLAERPSAMRQRAWPQARRLSVSDHAHADGDAAANRCVRRRQAACRRTIRSCGRFE